MIIGIDFDNTIVCYDEAFHRAAVERGLIPSDIPINKELVREFLRSTGREDDWTELQGYVYGERMDTVTAFAGVVQCIRTLVDKGTKVYIVSHKTLYPYRGKRCNLHDAALSWLDTSGFLSQSGLGMHQVFFELTKDEKIERIRVLKCTHFIDDLPEILSAECFPKSTVGMLFTPNGIESLPGTLHFRSWEQIATYFRLRDAC